MRNKELISKKIEQLANSLSTLSAYISTGVSVEHLKSHIETMQDKLSDMQTLINTESDSWN